MRHSHKKAAKGTKKQEGWRPKVSSAFDPDVFNAINEYAEVTNKSFSRSVNDLCARALEDAGFRDA